MFLCDRRVDLVNENYINSVESLRNVLFDLRIRGNYIISKGSEMLENNENDTGSWFVDSTRSADSSQWQCHGRNTLQCAELLKVL